MTLAHRLALLVLSAAILAGCAPMQIRTDPQPNQGACDAALAAGWLTEDPRSGVGLGDGAGGSSPVVWPHGFTASREPAGFVLLDASGRVVAREGQWVQLGGGTDGAGFFWACPTGIGVFEERPTE